MLNFRMQTHALVAVSDRLRKLLEVGESNRRTPIAHRCIGQRPPNRRRPLQTVRSISDADDIRTALCEPPIA